VIGDTDFGFRFGPALVERAMSLPEGRVVVTVKTDAGREIDIYVSRTGKSLRVFEKGRGELTGRGRSEA
jgi:hypothetical protein